MVDHFSHAFVVPNQLITAEYDARTDAALTRLVATLLPNAAQLLVGQLDEALTERELSWRNVLSGFDVAVPGQGRRAPLCPETFEDPGPHHHLRGHERASGPAPEARAGGLLKNSRATAGTWGP